MINTYSFCRMVQMLLEGEVTKSEIIEETGLHHATVGGYIRHMHTKRVVRVAEWRRCKAGRIWVPYWTLNPEGLADAKRPTRLSSAERSAVHRRKKGAIQMNQMLAGRPT